jgi:hypothetical protein
MYGKDEKTLNTVVKETWRELLLYFYSMHPVVYLFHLVVY